MGARRGRRRGAALLCLLTVVAGLAACRPASKRQRREQPSQPYLFDRKFSERAETDDDGDDALGAAGHVHAKARFVWIRRKPDADSEWIGYITLGQRVALRAGSRAVDGAGCESWVPVEPKGWVCVGRDATLDPDDPIFVHLQQRTANVTSPWPFDYARSVGAPRYRTLPSQRDQQAKEGKTLPLQLERMAQARAAKDDAAIALIDKRLVGVELALTGEAPPALFEPSHAIMETDEDVPLGSTIAYVDQFDHDGRSWLLGWDHAIIPQNRVKKYPRSEFRGVEIEGDVDLPLAFAKKQGAPKYRAGADGKPALSEDRFAAHALVELAEGQLQLGDQRLLETEEPGVYVAERDVIWVAPEARPPRALNYEGRRTWIEVSTVGGWLVAYEGDRPVYATAISAGRAEVKPDGTMVPSSSTPTGTYPIRSKLKSTTMRSDRRPNRSHAEVMYTQVFYEDYALHGAYWHDDWGDRRSAGCVNLAPIDSKWLFDWSEPAVPDGWHVKNVESGDAQTLVVVHF